MTPNAAEARAFYAKVFGWTATEMPMGSGVSYTVFHVKGKPAAGMMQMEGAQFKGVPPHWTSYLSVADCDQWVARARELGATVYVPPQDVPGTGRFSVLQDPSGAVFAVITFVPM